jgi:trigger factor
MVGRRIDDRLQTMARSLGQQGIQLEQYMQMMGRDLNSLAMELMPEAEREVREELALDAYADQQKIVIDDEKLRAFITEQANEENEAEEVVDRIMNDAAMREDVRRDLQLRDALDHAVAAAKEITPEQAEARANAREPQVAEPAKAEEGTSDDESTSSEQEN